MPNHCETDVFIRGKKEDVDAFAKWLEEIEPFGRDICRVLLPYPEPYKTMDEEAKAFSFFGNNELSKEERQAAEEAYQAKYGHTKDGYNAGGYEWCLEHWGTKWGVYEVDFTPATKRGALLSFQSAWSPPSEAVFEALAAKFPNLTFEAEWFEGGAGYCGGLTIYSNLEAEDYGERAGAIAHHWSGDYNGSRGG